MIKFGTGGFRGIIGDNFTKENVQLLTQALCDEIAAIGSDKPVAVGYDYRFGSDYFAQWTAEVLAANGVKCLLFDEPMPTPAVMFAVREEGLDFGIMITASHNPYYFNGYKLFSHGGMDADEQLTGRIEQRIAEVRQVRAVPIDEENDLVVRYGNKQRYIENIASFLHFDKPVDLKVLYDNMAGVGATCILPLFERLGVKNFTVLHSQHDAFFNFVNPNPTADAMSALKEMLNNGGYDFAMATDSDSDRLGILDEKGNYVSQNDILAAIYYYLVRYRSLKGDVVKNFVTSTLLDKLADKFGFCCHTVDVGFKNISAAMKKYDALVGGESSGGLTVRGYIYGKDSVFASALFLEMLTQTGKSVSALIEEMHRFADYAMLVKDANVVYDGSDLIGRITENPPQFGKKTVQVLRLGSNVKFCFERGRWAALRLSGTEPMVRLSVEAMPDEADELLGILTKSVICK